MHVTVHMLLHSVCLISLELYHEDIEAAREGHLHKIKDSEKSPLLGFPDPLF